MNNDPVIIDEERESWITLMMCRDAAKKDPDLRKLFEKRCAPEVVRAADECADYEDFKCLLDRYSAEGEGRNSTGRKEPVISVCGGIKADVLPPVSPGK